MALPRSYLFVPADKPDRFSKALGSGADAVIIDLEDAVAPEAKSQARDILANWLQLQTIDPRSTWIRINSADTEWHADDLRCFADAKIGGIVLPKSDDVDTIRQIVEASDKGQRLLPLIESANGIARVRALAAAPGVTRLMFGSIDLQVDLGMQCDSQESELLHFRGEVVLASRLAAIAAPIDGVTTNFNDESEVAAAVDRARRLGFGAKLCIHPRQVNAVNRGFLPSSDELAWAASVLEAVRNSSGSAISLNGKMIDKPVIAQAQRMLDRADAYKRD